MPYKTVEEAPANIRKLDGVDLSLSQVNEIAKIADSVDGADGEPFAIAISTWKKGHVVEGDVWVKKVENASGDEDEEEGQEYDDKKGFAKLKTVTLKNVPIFVSGTWHGKNSPKGGDTYTPEDILNMEKAFSELYAEHHPPLKLGHNQKQKLAKEFADEDGRPAVGWVTKVHSVMLNGARRLYATLSNVPAKLAELIRVKAFNEISPEIFHNYLSTSGKKYKHALAAISLLGENLPACTSMEDIYNLYGSKAAEVTMYQGKEGSEVHTYGMGLNADGDLEPMAPVLESRKKGKETEPMKTYTQEEVDAKLAEQKAEHEKAIGDLKKDFEGQLAGKDSEIKKFEDRMKSLEDEAIENRRDAKEAKVDAFIAANSSESVMRFTSKEQKAEIKTVLMAADDTAVQKYALGKDGAEVEMSPFDLLVKSYERMPNQADNLFSMQSHADPEEVKRAKTEAETAEAAAAADLKEMGRAKPE